MNVSVVLFTSFVFLLIMGVPVAASLTFASFIYLFGFTNIPVMVVAQKFFVAADSYSLMAIPFFIIAGAILEKGGVAKRLVDMFNAILGWPPEFQASSNARAAPARRIFHSLLS
jgi:C4-dicarboxylate transporter, DctM subunit